MVDVESADVDSTFERITEEHWRGTHTYRLDIVRNYYNIEDTLLKIHSHYYKDGEIVKEMEENWSLDRAEDGTVIVPMNGKSIEEFVERNHFTNPELDIAINLELLE